MDRIPHGVNKGKVVYYVNGQRFENSSITEKYVGEDGKEHSRTKTIHDGKEKAESYCLDNFLNPSDIIKFDSRTECNRYEYLLEQQKAGKISNLGYHFTLKIIPEFVNANGDTIPALTYEADFIYFDCEKNQRIVEDVKGSEYFIDEAFITKKKVFDYLMFNNQKLYIKIVLLRNQEWAEYKLGEQKKSQKLIKKQREQLKALKAERHANEVKENLKRREIERLQQLRKLQETTKLSKVQRDRLAELEAKYSV